MRRYTGAGEQLSTQDGQAAPFPFLRERAATDSTRDQRASRSAGPCLYSETIFSIFCKFPPVLVTLYLVAALTALLSKGLLRFCFFPFFGFPFFVFSLLFFVFLVFPTLGFFYQRTGQPTEGAGQREATARLGEIRQDIQPPERHANKKSIKKIFQYKFPK